MDLGFESGSESYDEEEDDEFYFSYSGEQTSNNTATQSTLNTLSLNDTMNNATDKHKAVESTNALATQLKETKIDVSFSGEDWDAECDENAPEFVIPAHSLFDPYTQATISEDGHDELDYVASSKEVRKSAKAPTVQTVEPFKGKSLTAEAGIDKAGSESKPSQRQTQMTKRQWLNEIEDLYFEEKDEPLKEAFKIAFDCYEDPYDLVLYFAANAYFDLYSKRPQITRIALDCFNSWTRSKFFANSRAGKTENTLLQGFHQESAMDLIVSTGLNYIDSLISIYELKEGDKKSQAKKLNRLFERGDKHKEAAIIAGKLGLQNYFEPEEIMLPLLAFDKVQVIETFVDNDKKQQDLFLKLMDHLCSKDDETLINYVSNKGWKIVDKNKFKSKTLQKISEKYVKKYNLDPVDYPHIFQTKNTQSLHLLLRKMYQERKATGRESKKWEGLLEGAVVGSTQLQGQLVHLLETEYHDIEAAVSWAQWCGLPANVLPPKCRSIVEAGSKRVKVAAEYSRQSFDAVEQSCKEPVYSTSAEEFYQLSLPRKNIFFVDTCTSLYKCLPKLFRSGSNIGFDAEWVPTYGRAGTQERLLLAYPGAPFVQVLFGVDNESTFENCVQTLYLYKGRHLEVFPRVAIIQLATIQEIFIIDLISLNETESGKTAIKELLEELLTSKDNLVIGYGVTSDIRILMNNYPYIKEYVLQSQRFIDICELSQTIFTYSPVKSQYPDPSSSEEKGLSLLVKRCLGKYLDKTYQVSNWEKRPLFEEQIIYAALDAYCLLEVYDKLLKAVQNFQLEITMEPALYVPGVHQAREKTKKAGKVQPEIMVTCIVPGPPRSPGCLKIVCDTMLQGLGRSLRCCGIDTIVLGNEEHHTKAIELSHKEKRIILTKGRPFYKLRGYVSPRMIMEIPNVPSKDQIAAVLKRYNIRITKKDIFSRCQNCNGNYYVKVSSEEMTKAYEIKIGNLPPDNTPSKSPIDYQELTINNGVSLRLEYIQKPQLEKVDYFYCCGTCGKIYWDGSHYGRKVDQFKELLSLTNEDETVYESCT